jgi:hypothetical protein
MSTYNGHPSWGYWNVSLWINNDEGLYDLARECIRREKGRAAAARAFVSVLAEWGTTKTPDGAPFSAAKVIHAMRGM